MSTPAPAPSLFRRALNAWSAVHVRYKVHAVVLAGLAAAAVSHQRALGLANWYIEDSAISFAYAKHIFEGQGPVPFAGGELIEGYSNALWVALMALFHFAGIDGFQSAKLMAAVLGAATVPLVYLMSREALPEHDGEGHLIAPLALASYSQFAIWNASALENSLFNFLLALAAWRGMVEIRRGSLPLSAFVWFLLSATRPDGIMYAAIGGFWFMIFTFVAGRGIVPTFKWLAIFWIPWGIYNAWRYYTFAWFFPNTYYAKEKVTPLMDWNHRSWRYVRNWGAETWSAWMLPIFLTAVIGTKGRRWMLALAASAFVAFVYIWPQNAQLAATFDAWPDFEGPDWWGKMRIFTAAGIALAMPLLCAPDIWLNRTRWSVPGFQARIVLWCLGSATVFFAVYTAGDWMKGFRWLSLCSVPYAVLFGVGVVDIAGWVQRWFTPGNPQWKIAGWVVGSLLATVVIPGNLDHTQQFSKKKETGPFSVKQRVRFEERVAERLFIDERMTIWDVDQGAHMFWGKNWMMDMGGLIDVSVAHHQFEKPFIKEYLFEEMKPQYAHLHGGWASSTRIPTYPEWKRDYYEIPGYPAGKKAFHIGNHLRRDVILKQEWKWGEGREVVFSDGITLTGWHVPSEAAKGRLFYVEAGFRSRNRRKRENFRVLLVLYDRVGDEVHSYDLATGYDWIPPHEWREDEIFHGKWAFQLPKKLPEGDYDVGFVVLGSDGTVLPAGGPAPEPPTEPGEEPVEPIDDAFTLLVSEQAVVGGRKGVEARFARGEVRFPGLGLTIVSVDKNARLAKADRELSLARSAKGECEEAEHAWWEARMHRPRNKKWHEDYRPVVQSALAQCWSLKARDEPENRVASLDRARRWDHNDPTYLSMAIPISQELYDKGMEARAAENWELAYRLFTDSLSVYKRMPWSRRYAEEARDKRLGLSAEQRKEIHRERERKNKARREAKARRRKELKKQGIDFESKGKKGKAKAKKPKVRKPKTLKPEE